PGRPGPEHPRGERDGAGLRADDGEDGADRQDAGLAGGRHRGPARRLPDAERPPGPAVLVLKPSDAEVLQGPPSVAFRLSSYTGTEETHTSLKRQRRASHTQA